MGLGLMSLLRDYVQLNIEMLVRSLNDDGLLGAVSRKLLVLQQSLLTIDTCPHDQFRTGLRHFTAMKQIALGAKFGINLTDKGDIWAMAKPRLTTLVVSAAAHHALSPTVISPHLLMPLYALGLDLPDLLDKNHPGHIIDTASLANLLGNKCKRIHKASLNKLAGVLNGHKPGGFIRQHGVGPLPLALRCIPEPLVSSLLHSAGREFHNPFGHADIRRALSIGTGDHGMHHRQHRTKSKATRLQLSTGVPYLQRIKERVRLGTAAYIHGDESWIDDQAWLSEETQMVPPNKHGHDAHMAERTHVFDARKAWAGLLMDSKAFSKRPLLRTTAAPPLHATSPSKPHVIPRTRKTILAAQQMPGKCFMGNAT
jgi:hypothetical protein